MFKVRPVNVVVPRNIYVPIIHRSRLPNTSRSIQCKANLVDVSYYVGKSIILFTMFYCGLNWLHYKELREREEKENDVDNKK